MNPIDNASVQFVKKGKLWSGQFRAMASPCEILIEIDDRQEAERIIQIGFKETLRIERKFSRYRTDNIIYEINNAAGKSIRLDDETSLIFEYADLCYKLSEGLFDITSGALRKIWTFDGSDKIPTQEQITKILRHVGREKLNWRKPLLTLESEMEIDFGGIGKEYAVDRAIYLIQEQTSQPVLVNFGGDLAVTGPMSNNSPWQVGIEKLDSPTEAFQVLEISAGALATSGDSKRYLLKNGIRYGHILNPKTGYPIESAPRSITVAAANCIQAGSLATLAILQGENAEQFLKEHNCLFWCLR